MKRQILFTAVVAALSVVAQRASALTYAELSGTNATLPAGSAEYFQDSGFGNLFFYDTYGRVISNAAPTTTATPGPLTQITMKLWSGSDVDLYQIHITDPASFTAYITNTVNKLVLFDASGTALDGVTGGASVATGPNVIKGTDIPGLVAGTYYIGESNSGGQPHNAAGAAIFDFTNPGEILPLAGVADKVLASDPFLAWGLSNASNPSLLIGTNTLTSGGSTINLTGTDFAVTTPEPASMALVGAGALALVARRRRTVG